MRAGRLARSVLTLQGVVESTTSYGAAEIGFGDLLHTFRGEINQLSGSQSDIAGGVQEEAEYEIRVRYNSALTTRRRLSRDETGQIFEILGVSDKDGKKHEMILRCREVVQ